MQTGTRARSRTILAVVEGVIIQPVEPSRTYALRQQILRPNLSVEEMGLFGDDGPETGTYGAIDETTGEVVGTAVVRREEPPSDLAESLAPRGEPDAWRLRSMATREDLRGRGLGAEVLEACMRHVGGRGGGVLWCNARVGARRFYSRAGFSEWGEEFESQGVEHVVMWRMVEADRSTG
jgi:predicted GNAT family N-acyltransferase